MKTKRPYPIFIVILTIFSLFVLTNFINSKKIDFNNSFLNAVESNNNYVIQNSIISPDRLHDIINNTDVKILYIETENSIGQYIPNTRKVKYGDIVITVNEVPGLVADKDQIDSIMSKLGILNDDTVIIYDKTNSVFATRLFWTLKVYGHEYVKILNGGLDAWVNQGYKTENQPLTKINPKAYYSNDKNENMVATLENIKEALKNNDEVIIDVRRPEEYNKGHIPTAISIPYYSALNNNGLFKTYQQLQKIYEPLGVTKDKSTIYIYCTRGNSSSFTYFVLHELMGYNNVVVYDGSYTEYEKSGQPIEY